MTIEAVREIAGALQMAESELPDGAGWNDFAEAVTKLKTGELDDAIKLLIEVLKTDRLYLDDAARRLGVALFTVLGPEHPVTTSNRRLFDMYLS